MSKFNPLWLVERAVEGCTKCPLSESRRFHAVPGSGPATAKAVMVAEKPGVNEDKVGLPMVGKTGDFLEEILSMVGLKKQDFFITNLVKCKPASGHQLTVEEMEACDVYLQQQLEIIEPKVVVYVGSPATQMSGYWPGERIGEVHGKPRVVWVDEEDETFRVVVPTYHPASVLNTEDEVKKKRRRQAVIEDFKVVASIMKEVS